MNIRSFGRSSLDTGPVLWGRAVGLVAWVSLVVFTLVRFAGAAIVVGSLSGLRTGIARAKVESPIVGDGRRSDRSFIYGLLRRRSIRPVRDRLVLRGDAKVTLRAWGLSLVQAGTRRLSHIGIRAIVVW